MKVDNNANVEQFLKIQMFSQILQNVGGSSNSGTFQIMLQSLLSAMDKSGGKSDLSALGLGALNVDQGGTGSLTNMLYNNVMNNTSINNSINTLINNSVSGSDHNAEGAKIGNTSIDNAIKLAAKKYGVEENLIRAVIKQESDFNPRCVSRAGAMGLMQLMPVNVKDAGISNPFDIGQNIDAGTSELKSYLSRYSENKKLALAAYNAGPGRLQRTGGDLNKLPGETKSYIKKVLSYYQNGI